MKFPAPLRLVRRIAALGFIFVFTPTYAQASPASAHAQALRIDGIVRYVMGDRHINGLVLGIARDGAPILVRGYGFADRRRTRRARAGTIFPIGSLTKSFTAALVRALARKGIVALGDPLGRYVPEYPAARDLTLDRLLAQTAGIADYAQLASFDRSSREPAAPSDIIARIAGLPLASSDTFAYSNTDYVLAALVAERAASQPYAALLHRLLLTPLGLAHTRIAHAYLRDASSAEGSIAPGSASLGFGCADLESTAGDLLTWSGDLDAGTIAPAPRAIAPYDDGFFFETLLDRPAAFASGYVAGYSSFFARMRDGRVTVVVLTNADAVDLAPLAKSILAIVLGVPEAQPT
jgi:CubicO group peptidase (beta-lactamase class C family)